VAVRPIFVDEVGRFNAALREHHWLGHRLTGQVLRYVAVLDGEWVAVAGFGSAVLSCRARDEFLGWSREQQYARLRHVANNQRFCVLAAGCCWSFTCGAIFSSCEADRYRLLEGIGLPHAAPVHVTAGEFEDLGGWPHPPR
jgi:hypothetical protein